MFDDLVNCVVSNEPGVEVDHDDAFVFGKFLQDIVLYISVMVVDGPR